VFSAVIISGLILGFLLSRFINKISLAIDYKIEKKKIGFYNYLIVFITGTAILISFFKFGLSLVFIKAIFLDCILIVTAFIDFKHQVIPNRLVIVTLLAGIFFTFICDISLKGSLIGMFVGGGILFLLACIPKVMGGGDVKFMFALGSFLGAQKVLTALFLAFVIASVASILLLIFKLKGRKDYIPFGPFLAIGCFVSFHIILLL
jgi:leader peptidase (prepilin peptidase) / N-methyltransferase